MGWMSLTENAMGEHNTPKAYLDDKLTWEETDKGRSFGCRLIESACVLNKTYYAAVESYASDKPSSITAAVILVRWNPRAKDGYIFSHKDMDETMGPSMAECPMRILRHLSPIDEPYALDWRNKCFKYHRLQSRALKNGDLIQFPEAICFGNDEKLRKFRVLKKGRKIHLTRADGTGRYRIPNIMQLPFAILKETRVRMMAMTIKSG